jgi:hypothetical protein
MAEQHHKLPVESDLLVQIKPRNPQQAFVKEIKGNDDSFQNLAQRQKISKKKQHCSAKREREERRAVTLRTFMAPRIGFRPAILK